MIYGNEKFISHSKYLENIYHNLDDPKDGTTYLMTSILAENCAIYNSISKNNYELIEANAFYQNDQLTSALILLKSKGANDLFVECQFDVPEPILTTNENELSVSSKFDVKEQVFPSPLFVISQEEEIHFLYKSYSEQDFLVNSIWISPSGNILHVTRNSLVNATSGYLLEKISFKTCKYDTLPWKWHLPKWNELSLSPFWD